MNIFYFMGEDEYVPEYAKGEILVWYSNTSNPGEQFGEALGYKLSENQNEGERTAIVYNVPVGKEEEAMANFRKYPAFVTGVDRRDLKLERRSKIVEELCDRVINLDGLIDSSDKVWDELMKKSLSDLLR